MNRKPGIPLVAMIIFFALIIGIIITCIIILSTQSGSTSKQTISFDNKTSSSNSNSNTQNEVMQNAIVNEEEEQENEDNSTEEEIDLSSQELADLFKLSGNQKTYVKYAIYKDEQFSNDVKLKMALGQVKDSEIKSEGNNKTISKETVDKYLGESFEDLNGISYSDVELFNDDTFSNYYNIDRYVYNQNNSEYEVVESGINEKEPPLINEVIKKAVKKGNKIEVYVVPLFIKTYEFNIDNQTGMAYQFYGSYNYSGKSFESPLYLASNGSEFAITGDTYRQELLSNNTADGYNYQNVHDNIKDFDNLQVYKYTYTKDSNSGKYHITSFEKANENNNNNNNNDNNESSDNNSNNTGNQ